METWISVAGWTLVHFVWQGALIAAGAALGFYVLRDMAANARYLLASAALSLMLLSPVVTAFVVSSPAARFDALSAPASAPVPSVFAPAGAGLELQNARTHTQSWSTLSPLQRLPRAFPVIVVTWLAGVAMLLTRLLGGWWRVRTLQRTARLAPPSPWQAVANRLARRLGVRRMVRVADADIVETPTLVGWWRPIIMLPVAGLAGLTPSQADAILAHELAHIRRHDYLVNLLQHVAETVLFYHPAVWWVSRRMRVERERCCDAIVVDRCTDPLDYATALMRLEEARRPSAGFALAATGGSLLERVRFLLGAKTDRHTPLAHALVTTMMIALVVLVVGGGYHWSSRTLQAHDRTSVNAAVASAPIQRAGPNQIERILPAKEDAPVRATDVSATADAGPTELTQQRTAVDQVDSERVLEDALRLANPPADMTLAVEVNYFQLNRAEYAVPVSVRIPGSELALARSRGAERTTIDFVGEVKDQYGITIQNVRDRMDIGLSDDAGAQLAMRSIQYETALTMLPGQYSLRLAARDAETGRIGTFRTTFQIPNLNREEKTVPISTVVLGSQLVRLNGDGQNGVRPDPLVYDGLKLIPSVTREFSTSRDMYVFLQAYQRDATTTQPLVATVALYRDGVKAFETVPLQVTEGLEPRSKAVPVRLTVPLGGLAPGVYDCEVSVVDTLGQKVTFWRTPVVLVP